MSYRMNDCFDAMIHAHQFHFIPLIPIRRLVLGKPRV
jgi:hypothetical protein